MANSRVGGLKIVRPPHGSTVLLGVGLMSCMRCDHAAAVAFNEEAAAIARDLNDRRLTAQTAFHLGESVYGEGDRERAERLYTDLADTCPRVG